MNGAGRYDLAYVLVRERTRTNNFGIENELYEISR